MTVDSKITDWHRSFGMAMESDFADYPFEVKREQDMSIQEEYLDVLIINTKKGMYPGPLPDGFENLRAYNLISYKSLHESLNVWTIEELIGHYVSYRKILGGEDKKKKNKKRPPEEHFQLYAICTMYPRKLLTHHKYEKIQQGVYDLTWGARQIRIIVLSEVSKSKKNLLWNIFSNVKENIEYGIREYQKNRSSSKLMNISSVIDNVFTYYGLEGLHMAYTMEQYQKDHFVRKLPQFFNDTKIQDRIFQTISNNWTVNLVVDRLKSIFSARDIISNFSPDERLEGLSLDERLEGLSKDEVQAYLRNN